MTTQGLLAASSRQETAKLQLELSARVAELGSKGAEVKKLQARMRWRLLDDVLLFCPVTRGIIARAQRCKAAGVLTHASAGRWATALLCEAGPTLHNSAGVEYSRRAVSKLA